MMLSFFNQIAVMPLVKPLLPFFTAAIVLGILIVLGRVVKWLFAVAFIVAVGVAHSHLIARLF